MCFSGRSASRAASREPPAQKSRAEPTPSPASPQLAEPSLTTLLLYNTAGPTGN